MLQDVHSSTSFFGGITIVFGGDFQQTLPVVTNGSHGDVVQATVQCSEVWHTVDVLHLTENMRIHTSDSSPAFVQWLVDIGQGRSNTTKECGLTVSLPSSMLSHDENDLIMNVYNSLTTEHAMPSHLFFLKRAILAGRNDDIVR
jgi:hypothetical protein